MIIAHLNFSTDVLTRNLILDGSSQWVFEQIIICFSNICRLNSRKVMFGAHNDIILHFQIAQHDNMLYSIFTAFLSPNVASSCYCISSTVATIATWPLRENIINWFYRHFCGHSDCGCTRHLLLRNNLWNNAAVEYVKK